MGLEKKKKGTKHRTYKNAWERTKAWWVLRVKGAPPRPIDFRWINGACHYTSAVRFSAFTADEASETPLWNWDFRSGSQRNQIECRQPHHQWKILSAKIIYQPLGLFLYIINKLKSCTNKCSVLLYHRYGLTVLTAVDASISLNNSNVMCFFAKLGILISKEFTLCHNTVWVIPQKGPSALPASYGYTTWTYLVIVIKSCLILHITILDENWFKIKQSALLWHFIPASVTATSTSTSIASLPRMLQCKAIY